MASCSFDRCRESAVEVVVKDGFGALGVPLAASPLRMSVVTCSLHHNSPLIMQARTSEHLGRSAALISVVRVRGGGPARVLPKPKPHNGESARSIMHDVQGMQGAETSDPSTSALPREIYDALTPLDDRLVKVLLKGDIRVLRCTWLITRPDGYRLQTRQELEALERSGGEKPLLSLEEAETVALRH